MIPLVSVVITAIDNRGQRDIPLPWLAPHKHRQSPKGTHAGLGANRKRLHSCRTTRR